MLERTFRADEKVALAIIDKREMQYLYREGDALRLHGQRDLRPDARRRRDARRAPSTTSRRATPRSCTMYDGEVVGVELPAAVELTVSRDRARRAGRPRVGRPQAGDARDRARRAGAAVRRAGRDASRSTPAPGSTWRAPDRRWPSREAAAKPGSGPSASVTSSRCATSRVDDAARAAAGAARRVRRAAACAGVEEHHADVDALLRKFSEHWALERMPAVDRAVLRLGCLRARAGSPRCRPRS